MHSIQIKSGPENEVFDNEIYHALTSAISYGWNAQSMYSSCHWHPHNTYLNNNPKWNPETYDNFNKIIQFFLEGNANG